MRSVCVVGGLLTLVAGAAALSASGCVIDYIGGCEGTRTCEPTVPFGYDGSTGAGGGGGAGGSGGWGSAGGAGGHGGEGLDPCTPRDDETSVPDDCGVFVSKDGDDIKAKKNPSKQAPFRTFNAALAFIDSEAYRSANRPRNVYVCDQKFEEEVVVHEATAIYGGLNCAIDWRWTAGARSSLTSPADTVPLTIFGGEGRVRVERMEISARNATVTGGSSIAVRAQNGLVELTRCELKAGAGAPGESPVKEPQVMTTESADGKAGEDANCGSFATLGGSGGAATPDSGGCSAGGKGGYGGNGVGQPGDDAEAGGGLGGIGATTNQVCTSGDDGGAANEAGAPGTGASAMEIAEVEVWSEGANGAGPYNYRNASGQKGLSGANGKGGGGGGSGSGYSYKIFGAVIKCKAGAGGGGGAGGCGGNGGAGGGGGGSSIGVLIVNTEMILEATSIDTSSGGAGGNGAAGQDGANGGKAGVGGAGSVTQGVNGSGHITTSGCPGGAGGKGSKGGGGGGGRGGHSIGILSLSSTITPANVPIKLGPVGAGGNGGDQANTGAQGVQKDVLLLPQ